MFLALSVVSNEAVQALPCLPWQSVKICEILTFNKINAYDIYTTKKCSIHMTGYSTHSQLGIGLIPIGDLLLTSRGTDNTAPTLGRDCEKTKGERVIQFLH